MRSQKKAEPLDGLESEVRVSAADNAALQRARALNAMDPDEYLRFLLAFTKTTPPSRETNTDADEPFTL